MHTFLVVVGVTVGVIVVVALCAIVLFLTSWTGAQ